MPASKDSNQEVCAQQQPTTTADKIKEVKLAVKTKPGVDTDCRWVKKQESLDLDLNNIQGQMKME